MRIDIQTSGSLLTNGLREHATRRLQFALSWANHDVRKAAVRQALACRPAYRAHTDACY